MLSTPPARYREFQVPLTSFAKAHDGRGKNAHMALLEIPNKRMSDFLLLMEQEAAIARCHEPQ